MKRGAHKGANYTWDKILNAEGAAVNDARAMLAVLMDIREELRAIGLALRNVEYDGEIPRRLRSIRRTLARPRRKR